MDPNQVPSALRLKVEAHVLSKLRIAYPHVLPGVATAEASAIETTAFAKAKSRGEYICMVTSYTEIHHQRNKTSNDAYRIPKLSASEESTRTSRYAQLLAGEGERIQRDTQRTVNEELQRHQRNRHQNVQNSGRTAGQPVGQPSIPPNVQANIQANLLAQQNVLHRIPQPVSQQQIPQQVSQQQIWQQDAQLQIFQPTAQQQILRRAVQQQMSQPVAQQQIFHPTAHQHIPQRVTHQQMTQVQPNMVNPQTASQAMIQPPAQNHGVNIINHASGQPMQNMQTTMVPNTASPAGFHYVFPYFPLGHPQGAQPVNSAANTQQTYVPMNYTDPSILPQTQVNPTVMPNQAFTSQAVCTPQTIQNPPSASNPQRIARPVVDNAQNPILRPGPNGPPAADQFSDDMITELAHQNALASAAQSASTAHMQGNFRPHQQKRRIVPNGGVLDPAIQNPQMPLNEKSQLVAKWIHLQRAYRPRIERIKKVLDMIMPNPTAEQRNILEELEQVQSVLRVTVERLMGDNYSEINYMKAAAHLTSIVEKFRKYEQMDWAEVKAHVDHNSRVRDERKPSQSPNAADRIKQTLLVQERPMQTTNLRRASQSPTASQGSHRAVWRSDKMTIRDAQNQVSNLSQIELQEQQLRAARSKAAQEVARRHRMRTATGKRKTSLPAFSPQQRQENGRRTLRVHPGVPGHPSNVAPGDASGSTIAAEAIKQAPPVFKAGNAATAGASAHFNARKRTVAQTGMENQFNSGPMQKKASMSKDQRAIGNSVASFHPSVQRKAGSSEETEAQGQTIAKQTIQPQKTNNASNAPASQRLQAIVKEHLRSNVAQHVREHIEHAISVPSKTPAGNPEGAMSGITPLSVVRKQQEQLEKPKTSKQTGIVGQPGGIERPRTVEQAEPLTSVESNPQTEPGKKEVDPSALDILTKTRSLEDLAASIESSRRNLIRALAEDPIVRQALSDSVEVSDDEEGIESFQAFLDGEEMPNRSQRVEETLRALQGNLENPKTPLEPNIPSKPKTSPNSKNTKKLTLIQLVKEGYEAFEKNCDFVKCELHQEYKKPVLLCKAMTEEIMIPNLVLRVFKGYPSAGTVTYSFQEPAMGWCGPLNKMRSIFKESMRLCGEECGVDEILEAWKSAIIEVTRKTKD